MSQATKSSLEKWGELLTLLAVFVFMSTFIGLLLWLVSVTSQGTPEDLYWMH